MVFSGTGSAAPKVLATGSLAEITGKAEAGAGQILPEHHDAAGNGADGAFQRRHVIIELQVFDPLLRQQVADVGQPDRIVAAQQFFHGPSLAGWIVAGKPGCAAPYWPHGAAVL